VSPPLLHSLYTLSPESHIYLSDLSHTNSLFCSVPPTLPSFQSYTIPGYPVIIGV